MSARERVKYITDWKLYTLYSHRLLRYTVVVKKYDKFTFDKVRA